MRIAIDVSPLQSGHKVRGVGFYLERLKHALLDNFSEHSYTFFSTSKPLSTEVDIIHYPYFEPFFSTLPFNKKHKTVVTVHDLTPLVFPKHFPAGVHGNLQWQLQRLKLKKVDAIITDSIASKNDILEIVGVIESNVSVVYLAASEEFKRQKVSEKRRKELIKKYNIPPRFVLYVGDITWNKNVPRLVEAIQQLDLSLVMIGKALVQKEFDRKNPWNKDLVTLQTLLQQDSRIIRLGFVSTDDLVDLYNMASVFAFPSLYEGFGLPVIEAMQSGVPVVTTREGSLGEVAGDAAEYVDGYKTQSIAEGISKVYQSQNLRETMIIKGLEQAKKFNWKKTAEETIAVYERVLRA